MFLKHFQRARDLLARALNPNNCWRVFGKNQVMVGRLLVLPTACTHCTAPLTNVITYKNIHRSISKNIKK